jgi:hypothetical protein
MWWMEKRELVLGSLVTGRPAILYLPYEITVDEVTKLENFVAHIRYEAEQRAKEKLDNLKAARGSAAKEETRRVEPIRVAPSLK